MDNLKITLETVKYSASNPSGLLNSFNGNGYTAKQKK